MEQLEVLPTYCIIKCQITSQMWFLEYLNKLKPFFPRRGWCRRSPSYPDNGFNIFWQHRPVELVRANGSSDKESSRTTQYFSDHLHPCKSFTVKRRGNYQRGKRKKWASASKRNKSGKWQRCCTYITLLSIIRCCFSSNRYLRIPAAITGTGIS